VNIIIDNVVGWDVSAGRAHPHGGLFGEVTAFHAITESQNSTGDLHAHMLVWVKGLPTSVNEYYDCWKSEEYRDAALAYTQSVITNKLPHMPTTCPRCGTQSLSAVPLTQAAYKKGSSRARSFPTSECTSCHCQFGGDMLLQELISTRAEKMGVHSDLLSDEAIRCRVASPCPLAMPTAEDNVDSLLFSRTLLTYQHHHWYHSKSCFKASCRIPKGDTCRMFFPKERHEHADATSDGRA
jgi:hypothetical protein